MFTGIVQGVGEVVGVDHEVEGSRIRLASLPALGDVAVGDSIALDGVCLTVTTLGGELAFDAIPETLRRTTLGELAAGSHVNVEGALRAGDRLGGHVVQGHVDGVGGIVAEHDDGSSRVIEIVPPSDLLRYVVEKGSIAVAGVSLTISSLTRDGFEVSLIPHTCAATTLGSLPVGARVNLEVDMFAKYVERLVAMGATAPATSGAPTGEWR